MRLFLFSLAILILPVSARAAGSVSYNREIRPILSENCFLCHGPDATSRKPAKNPLRLDSFAEATAVRDDGTRAVQPGDPERSTILRRIRSTDADEMMPPPDQHKKLTPREIGLLERWISEGAAYEGHWAWQRLPAAVPVPEVSREGFPVRSPLDAFILDRIVKEGLTPSPEVSRELWLRRATFDLTGLPPTPAEMDAFLADTSAEAMEKAADRLLASPQYGEKMAMHWLEVARYADSYGYQADIDTNAWPWRDWVIRAFNDNLPWDQFITWQIAGDLLPEATQDQRLATAFNRIHRKTQEGGSVAEEFRQEGVSDRVHTVGFAFLGLTMECTRCHDHKYDPLTMQDYYGMGAFFNSIDEWGLIHGNASITPHPVLRLMSDGQKAEWLKLFQKPDWAEFAWREAAGTLEPAFEKWLTERPSEPVWADRFGNYSLDEAPQNKLKNDADPAKPGSFRPQNSLVEGHSGKAVQFTGDDSISFDKGGVSHQNDPLSVSFRLKPAELYPRAVIFHSTDGWDPGYNGYELLLEEGRLRWTWQREWPGNCISVQTKVALPVNEWTHITVTYDGSSRAAGLLIYLNGVPAAQETVRDKLERDCGSFDAIHFGERRRDNGLRGGMVDEISLFSRAVTAVEAAQLYDGRTLTDLLKKPVKDLSGDERWQLCYYWRSAIAPTLRTMAAKVREERGALRAFMEGLREIPVMEEDKTPRPAYILARGAYDAPKDTPAPRSVPGFLPPLPPDAPQNRLGFAKWLVQPDHPLTARVTVNRLWQEFFGRGIVVTSENFGLQGSQPTHPELLDWLARDFISSGWNVKQFARQIVLSSTYRQSAALRPELLERDRDNALLARGPARRLTAEMLRDGALAVGGLLVPEIGGPPVKPSQPDGSMWRALNSFLPEYQTDKGAGRHRRSLYTFWRRTTPPPGMMSFDTSSRDVCSVRRQQTNTPLQPLVLLNDPQFVEAAGALGLRALKEGGADDGSRAAWMFRTVTGRAADPRELQLLTNILSEQRALFAASPENAVIYLKSAPPAPEGIAPPDLAAAASLGAALLNLDAAIMLR